MNELIVFNNEEFGEIRTITIDGEPWFVANDILRVLAVSNLKMLCAPWMMTKNRG